MRLAAVWSPARSDAATLLFELLFLLGDLLAEPFPAVCDLRDASLELAARPAQRQEARYREPRELLLAAGKRQLDVLVDGRLAGFEALHLLAHPALLVFQGLDAGPLV